MSRAHRLGPGPLLGATVLGLALTVMSLGGCSKDRDNGPGGYCRADDWCHAGLICVARVCRQFPGVQPATDASVDSGRADTSTTDSGIEDSGATDGSTEDSGATDSAVGDTGIGDSGAMDSGSTDSGASDTGTVDSGPSDASIAG